MVNAQRSGSAQWANTTGINLLSNFRPGNKFRANGKSRDHAGVPIENEFTMVSENMVKSGHYFGVITAKTQQGNEVELRVPFSSRYNVPVNQR